MRTLLVTTFLSLDGVMQAPGGPGEDDSGGFTQGGWSVNYWDERMGEIMGEAMSTPFDLLLGRRTYDIFAAHWPHTDDPGAKQLNDATKYVVSNSHLELTWSNSVLIEGDAAEGIAALKKDDGPELQVHGSGNLDPNAAAPRAGRPRSACGSSRWSSERASACSRRARSRRALTMVDSEGLHDGCRDRHLRAGRPDRDGDVRVGVVPTAARLG